MQWIHGRSTACSAAILLGLTFCLALTLAHGWNEEDGIIKWNPTWFSNFKYSAPIGIRSRGYLFKRLTSEYPYGLKWSPSFLFGPFGGGAGIVRSEPSTRTEFTGPRDRKVLGWYSGPGSRYHLNSKDDSSEEDDDYVE